MPDAPRPAGGPYIGASDGLLTIGNRLIVVDPHREFALGLDIAWNLKLLSDTDLGPFRGSHVENALLQRLRR